MIDPMKNDPGRVAKLTARNARMAEQFRANGGKTDGVRSSLILMHTIGAKTGNERVVPVNGIPESDEAGSGWIVVAAVQGAPNNPDWYYNLLANPDIDIEYAGESGVETARVHVEDTPAEQWQAEFDAMCERSPGLRELQEKTERRIPILHLRRQPG